MKLLPNFARGLCRICYTQPRFSRAGYCRSCYSEYQAKKLREKKEEAFAQLGDSCKCCGETTPEFLTIDHVFNDGKIHRRKPFQMYRAVKEQPERFQVLCMNCNWGRRLTGECPHIAIQKRHEVA